MKPRLTGLLLVLPAVALFIWIAVSLDFTQDDAYISYRYVQNYLNGHGLVYNIGERIEGFTNFGWVVYLLMWGSWGLKFVLVSKITGYVLGALIVIVSYLIAKEVLGEKGKWYALLVAYLVGINQSVAYWSPAGLETAAFSVSVGLVILWWIRRSWLLIFGMVLAVWLRPEGAVVCGVLLIAEGIVERRLPRFSLYATMAALVLSLPMVGFKLGYYHGILPNPFYAKTSFHVDQLANGWEYTWQFLQHYGFYGVGLVVGGILLYMKRLSLSQQKVWWLVVGYMVYITLIGGDVLKVHRFYVPMVGVSALLLVQSVWALVEKLTVKTRQMVLFLIAIITLWMTWTLPREVVMSYNGSEKGLVYNLGFQARAIRAADGTDFTAASTTIGAFGYELLGHRVIDMLGLTDSTIARHPERPIAGLQSTWKEQHHNSAYLLSQAPDYIVFSTGIKPSAPAEKALFLYRQFVESYQPLTWYTPDPNGNLTSQVNNAFKKMHPLTGDIVVRYPFAYVDQMIQGISAIGTDEAENQEAIKHFDQAIRLFPDTPFAHLLVPKAFSLMQLGRYAEAGALLSEVLSRDSLVPSAYQGMFMIDYTTRNQSGVDFHRRWLQRLEPWFVEPNERLVRNYLGLDH